MEMWLEGFRAAVSGINLVYLIVGSVYGLIIGALPGLGPMFAVSLALPLTFGMPAGSAIILLAAVYSSCCYGGSFASILMNTPGSVTSVASCWDGYPLSLQGKSGYALGLSTASSLIGGLIGWISLVILAPMLMAIAMKMGPAEFFMIAILALSLLSLASRGQTISGIILAGIGLLISFIGRDPITATQRFTFGSMLLEDGLPMAVVFLGLFALSQAVNLFEKSGTILEVRKMTGGVLSGILKVLKHPLTILRSGILGMVLGVAPALGASTATIITYMVEKRFSKNPENFGKGEPLGVIAPEVANNSCVVGALIPALTLGIPGSGVAALFMAALMMHGISPGADFFDHGTLSYVIFAGILLAQVTFFFLGLLFAPQFAKVVMIPTEILVPMITILCTLGAYATRNQMIDIFIAVLFGMIGYILIKSKWPVPCLVLGFVLGSIIESNFHRTLMISGGSYLPFVTRPGSLILLLLTVTMLGWSYLKPFIIRQFKGRNARQ